MISAATAASGGGGAAAASFIMGQPSLTSQLTTTQHCNTRDGVFVLFCDLAFGILAWLGRGVLGVYPHLALSPLPSVN